MGMRWDKKLQRYVDDKEATITSSGRGGKTASSRTNVGRTGQKGNNSRTSKTAGQSKQNDFFKIFTNALFNPYGAAIEAIGTYNNTAKDKSTSENALYDPTENTTIKEYKSNFLQPYDEAIAGAEKQLENSERSLKSAYIQKTGIDFSKPVSAAAVIEKSAKDASKQFAPNTPEKVMQDLPVQEISQVQNVNSYIAGKNAEKKLAGQAIDRRAYEVHAKSDPDFNEAAKQGGEYKSKLSDFLKSNDLEKFAAVYSDDNASAMGMLTPDELATYNYYLTKNNGDETVANKYLESIMPDLQERIASALDENIESIDNELGKKAMRGILSAAGGLKNEGRALQNIPAAFTGSDEVILPGVVQQAQQKMRSRLEGPEAFVNDAIYSGTQMFPAIIANAIPGVGQVAGTAMVMATSYSDAYSSAIAQGYDPSEAAAYAIPSAVAEGLTQYALNGVKAFGASSELGKTVERAVQNVSKNPAVQKVMVSLGNMGGEALEEYLQANIDPVLRNLALGEDNEINPFSQDKLEAALMGAVLSGAMNAPTEIEAGIANAKQRTASVGAQYTSDIQSLIDSSKQSAPDTRAFKLGNKLQQKMEMGQVPSDYEIGRLVHENDLAIAAEQKTRTRQKAEEIQNKLGIQHAYNRNDIVELADGSEAAIVERDGNAYTVTQAGKPGYSTIDVSDISRKIEGAKLYDKFYAPEKKVQQYYENEYKHLERVATQKFVEDFGQAMGVNVDVRDFTAEGNTTVKGMYDSKTDTIFFDKNATRGQVLYGVIAHELTHAAESSPYYNKYFDYVIDRLTKGDPSKVERAIDFVRNGYKGIDPNMTRERALQEIVASYTESLYTSQEDIDALVKGQPNIAVRMYNAIRTAMDKLAAYFKGDKTKLQEINQYQELIRAREMFEKALKDRNQQTEAVQAYALNPNFEAELDNWDGVSNNIFDVGTPSSPLLELGIQNNRIVWYGEKIAKILKDHPEMTIDIIKQTPQVLEDPVMILKSNQVSPKNKGEASRLVLFGEVYDTEGAPVLAALEIRPRLKGGDILDLNIVKSAYGKSNDLKGFIEKSDALYLDPNKNRTNTWLRAVELQLPAVADSTYGSIGRITFEGKNVKIEGIPFKEWASGKMQINTKFSLGAQGPGSNAAENSISDIIINPNREEVNPKYSIGQDLNGIENIEKEAVQHISDADAPPLSNYETRPPTDKDVPPAKREYIPHLTDADAPPATEADLQAQTLKDALSPEHTVTTDEFKTAYAVHKNAAAEFGAVDRRLKLTESEKEAGKQIAAGNYDLQKYTGRPEVLEWARAYAARGNAEKVMHKYRLDLKRSMRERAQKAIEKSDLWKDKKTGAQYMTETAYRNNIDVMAKYDPEGAQTIQRLYFDPIAAHEAEANRFIAGLNDRIKALELSEAEAVLVQAYGEKMITDAQLDSYGKSPFGKIEFQNKENLVRKEFSKNQTIDPQKVRDAAAEFRKIYDELINMANDSRVRNGYAPIEKRSDYFPHFNEMTGKEKILSAFGIDITNTDAIPEGIAGITEFFNPGTKFFKNFQERKGIKTGFNAIEGFDGYIRGIKDVIFHTDDIQNLRALESALRSRHADETIRQKIDEINADPMRDAEAKQLDIQQLLKNTQESNLSGYITWLHEYTNGIAGKKSTLDRTMEQLGNRKAYTVMRKLSGRVASNMIGYNVGSWLTNFIPLVQAEGQIRTRNLLKGMKDTIKNWAKSDGFVQNSDFLVNRRGTDVLSKDALQKFTAAGVKPMEWIDNFVSETIVRAKYAEETRNGKTPEEAMRMANQTAANILADRSYGQMPTIFNAKNPLIKTLTMFQLEVNNQYRNLFKDLPRDAKASGGAWGTEIALGLLKYCIAAWLYNELYEKLTGRRPAFDPINIVKETAEDFADEKISKSQATMNVASNIAEQVPFLGGLIGGGRIPVSSAIPFGGNINDMASAFGMLADPDVAGEQKAEIWGKELAKPAWYILPPGGGGAVKKAAETAGTIAQGGEYSTDKDGNRKLKFATDGDAADLIKGMLFGKYATDGGRDYVESGFKQMSVPQTTAHNNLVAAGVKPQRAQKIIQDVSAAQSDVDADGETISGSKKKNALEIIDGFSDLDPAQKYSLYYDLLMSDTMKEDMDVAQSDYGISKMILVAAYKETYGITGDKDENGETIPGSKGKKIKNILDKLAVGGTKNEQEARREYLYEIFGVGENVAQESVRNQHNVVIKDAQGYDIPNYKGETLEKIASIGVSVQDYAYVDERLAAHDDKVGYIRSLGFDEKQTRGLVESLVMGKTARSKMTVAADMGIDKDVYTDVYIVGYTSKGSKAERNEQIRAYVDSLPGLSQEQKDALYEWNKVSKGSAASTGGSSPRRSSGGRRSSGSKGSTVSSLPEISAGAWTKAAAALKRSKAPKAQSIQWLSDMFREADVRREAMQQQLDDIDRNPIFNAKMKAAMKAEVRRRYQEG